METLYIQEHMGFKFSALSRSWFASVFYRQIAHQREKKKKKKWYTLCKYHNILNWISFFYAHPQSAVARLWFSCIQQHHQQTAERSAVAPCPPLTAKHLHQQGPGLIRWQLHKVMTWQGMAISHINKSFTLCVIKQ